MKIYKSVLFIFAIIFAFTIISFFFPASGIRVANITLRFPSVESIVTRDTAAKTDISKILALMTKDRNDNDSIQKHLLIRDSILNNIVDSILFYQSNILNHPTKLYLPYDDIFFFSDIFDNMENAQDEKRIIRILHYGDSQIELDRITSNIRSFFQERFGGGGPGMIPLIQPIPTASIHQRTSGSVVANFSAYGSSQKLSDGRYGIMGKCSRINGKVTMNITPTSSKTADAKLKTYSDITLLYKNTDELNVSLTDKRTKYQSTKKIEGNSLNTVTWHLDSTSSYLTIELRGKADIYGIMLDNGYGVNVDNFPMRGSSGTIFTRLNKTDLKKMLEMCDVDMIILQFGGNYVPTLSSIANVKRYAGLAATQIRFFQELKPEMKIVFIGPSDMSRKIKGKMSTYPFLPELVSALRDSIPAAGAAFWDMYEVMGGKNSMQTWVKSGYAGPDYIHFTTQGANIIGKAFVNTLDEFYNFNKYKNTIPEDLFDEAKEIVKNNCDTINFEQPQDTVFYE